MAEIFEFPNRSNDEWSAVKDDLEVLFGAWGATIEQTAVLIDRMRIHWQRDHQRIELNATFDVPPHFSERDVLAVRNIVIAYGEHIREKWATANGDTFFVLAQLEFDRLLGRH